jgi:serine/threonine protein kinase
MDTDESDDSACEGDVDRAQDQDEQDAPEEQDEQQDDGDEPAPCAMSVRMVGELGERWRVLRRLGEGTYAKVYLGAPRAASESEFPPRVAIKRYKQTSVRGEGLAETLLRELALMTVLRQHPHANVMRLHEVCYCTGARPSVNAVLEYMPHTLEAVLDDEQVPHSWAAVAPLLRQLLAALAHLHALGMVHRDLSVGNVFLSSSEIGRARVKLGDFNLSKMVSPNMTPGLVTLNYRAPELLCEARQYGTEIDMWSCGCVAAELLRGSILFEGGNEVEVLAIILATLGMPDARLARRLGLQLKRVQRQADRERSLLGGRTLVDRLYTSDPLALQLCCGMLALDPALRITAPQALALLG